MALSDFKKNLHYVLVMILLIILTIWATSELGNPQANFPSFGSMEKLSIRSVFTNGTSNAVFADIQSINLDITINTAIIKDHLGNVVITVPTNTSILQGQSAIMRINCNSTSGTYTALLVTPNGSSFVSPLFEIK